jgi:hypothetical protein
MSTNNKTKWTEQEIMNMSLDDELDVPLLTVGLKTYHPSGGWLPFPIANIYPIAQMDRTSGYLDYYGVNADRSASDDATDWVIFKFTRNGSGEVTKIQSKVGTWTARASGW